MQSYLLYEKTNALIVLGCSIVEENILLIDALWNVKKVNLVLEIPVLSIFEYLNFFKSTFFLIYAFINSICIKQIVKIVV